MDAVLMNKPNEFLFMASEPYFYRMTILVCYWTNMTLFRLKTCSKYLNYSISCYFPSSISLLVTHDGMLNEESSWIRIEINLSTSHKQNWVRFSSNFSTSTLILYTMPYTIIITLQMIPLREKTIIENKRDDDWYNLADVSYRDWNR